MSYHYKRFNYSKQVGVRRMLILLPVECGHHLLKCPGVVSGGMVDIDVHFFCTAVGTVLVALEVTLQLPAPIPAV